MEREKFNLKQTLIFIVIVLIFIFFGQGVGWRVIGGSMLIYSFKIFKEKKLGVGWEGYKPAYYITGFGAYMLGLLLIVISITLIFFPEQTVIKWGTK